MRGVGGKAGRKPLLARSDEFATQLWITQGGSSIGNRCVGEFHVSQAVIAHARKRRWALCEGFRWVGRERMVYEWPDWGKRVESEYCCGVQLTSRIRTRYE